MTVRQRSTALTTGPGEKLRNALGLGPEHGGTCAQLARVASQYYSVCKGIPFCANPDEVRAMKRMQIRAEGLIGALPGNYQAAWGSTEIAVVCPSGETILPRLLDNR